MIAQNYKIKISPLCKSNKTKKAVKKMEYLPAVLLFLSSLFMVFLLGIQSLNVNGGHYLAAALTSFLIGICNFFVLRYVPNSNFSLLPAAAYVAGGPIGIVVSMWFHQKFMKRNSEPEK